MVALQRSKKKARTRMTKLVNDPESSLSESGSFSLFLGLSGHTIYS
uniref:Uncharacterized protein n=1 Tax=Rhizophora mucronata TaxID=61149 RepID=A0A2P2QF33_RHIMU